MSILDEPLNVGRSLGEKKNEAHQRKNQKTFPEEKEKSEKKFESTFLIDGGGGVIPKNQTILFGLKFFSGAASNSKPIFSASFDFSHPSNHSLD